MSHGGDTFGKNIKYDFSVSLNPFPPADEITAAGIRGLKDSGKYPDIMQRNIKSCLAGKDGVSEANVLAGNGASELLLGTVKYISTKKALLPEPCYSGYEYVLGSEDCEVIRYSLKEEDGFIPTLKDIDNIWKEKPDLIFLTDPWNPSGKNISNEVLEGFLEKAEKEDTWVIIDESFLLLSEKSMESRSISKSELLKRYPKLVFITSFTKFLALPGIRMGYMVADSNVITGVQNLLPEWNLSIPAEYIMEAGIKKSEDKAYMESVIRRIREERVFLTDELRKLGFNVFDSDSCYIYFTGRPGLKDLLIDDGILIRDFEESGYYRIGLKDHKSNLLLIQKLTDIVTGETHEYTENKNIKTEWMNATVIEEKSFEIIGGILEDSGITLPEKEAPVIKRCIHTTADFEYVETLKFSTGAVDVLIGLIMSGADVVTDTNMALTGINKKRLAKFGGEVHCYMADEDVAKEAKERELTRAYVSMERAMKIPKPVIYVVGNAPTALISLMEASSKNGYRPAFIIGVPVGFVNVEAAKELVLDSDLDYIVNKGRKGGSNVAAAIFNAVLYQCDR